MKIRFGIPSSTFRLTLSYLAIIMVMSVGFSMVFYLTSARELDRPPGPDYYSTVRSSDPDHEVEEWLRNRAEAGQASLMMSLAGLNLATLLLGSIVSYYLARRTLRPIEATMEAQARFIADASHELRTPLTSLLLTNEVALRKKKISDIEARMHIKQNVHDLERLTHLSDELLDLAVVSEPLRRTEVQVADVVEAGTVQVRPLADEKNITIEVNVAPVRIESHQAKLVKLLVILLENAIKYSPDGAVVTVRSTVEERQLLLEVIDHGRGIASKDIGHIFDRFYRADQSRSTTEGHGLGLSIAAKLVNELDGSLVARSRPGHGATFTISIPR